ncbi:hypothetical protein VI817_006411 [Penicillium citrinum]|nr:hypothetical protein VI817_006411 [Penicillium citrinum]
MWPNGTTTEGFEESPKTRRSTIFDPKNRKMSGKTGGAVGGGLGGAESREEESFTARKAVMRGSKGGDERRR